MIKRLTITWDTDNGSMFTNYDENVTPSDILAMCEFAEGMAEFMIEEQEGEEEHGQKIF